MNSRKGSLRPPVVSGSNGVMDGNLFPKKTSGVELEGFDVGWMGRQKSPSTFRLAPLTSEEIPTVTRRSTQVPYKTESRRSGGGDGVPERQVSTSVRRLLISGTPVRSRLRLTIDYLFMGGGLGVYVETLCKTYRGFY